MPQVARRSRRALAVIVPVALVAAGAMTLAEREAVGCADPLLERPVPMAQALASSSVSDRALARANKTSTETLRTRARADLAQLWADRCGLAFYVDEATPEPDQVDRTELAEAGSARAPLAVAPLAETFALDSRPGAPRTVYLDFRGDEVSGTAWNPGYGSNISVAPYSLDADRSTSFSDAELLEIQHAWQVVSEDYAPFDVNITTREPDPAALARDSSADDRYGVTVHITHAGPIYDACRCGGVAYVNTFNVAGPNHEYYQPAWVFTEGTGTSGKSVGEAVSHEVGHNFGLSHDGTAERGYYAGAQPWAPVMGVGYYQPVSQWSAGEYTGASQDQDDLRIIATGAPVVADDHGDAPATATALTGSARGVIATRSDVDAFRLEAAGRTRVVVTPAAFANLDVQLTVRDASGSVLGVVDPPVTRTSTTGADGLGATWVGDVPATGTTLVATVDGTGHGSPRTDGGYSDYGSLGRYAVSVSTQAPQPPEAPEAPEAPPPPAAPQPEPAPEPQPEPPAEPEARPTQVPDPTTAPEPDPDARQEPAPDPLAVAPQPMAPARVGEPYRAGVGSAEGGSAPYAWSISGLPAGLALQDGEIRGTPTASGIFTLRLAVTDADGRSRTADSRLVVSAASAAPMSFRSTGWLPAAKQRRPYRTLLGVTGGSDVRRWQVLGNLPRGLRLRTNPAGTFAVVKGRPRRAGVSHVVLRVVDDTGQTVSARFSLAVQRKAGRARRR